MKKVINLDKSVHDLCSEYPEVKDIMKNLGFSQVVSNVALNTVGRKVSIRKGANMRGIDLDKIINTFKEYGFDVE